MIQQTTKLPGLQAVLTAHQSDGKSLMLVTLTAEQPTVVVPRSPMRVAIVIDRSGSMSGEPLEITKQAVARFIRSLSPDDQVSVIAYDDSVDVICGLVSPSEAVAQRVEMIHAGGSTDLYAGWVKAAKTVGKGGRVILLSDGQANCGRFTDAQSLTLHSQKSYERYGVTTTTIGIGHGYDEALMGGMARGGGGSHYFAHEVNSIMEAFSQERFSTESILLEGVSVRFNNHTEQLGHFWGGETKNRIFQVSDLKSLKATIRYTHRAEKGLLTEVLDLPTEFGYSEEVRLEAMLQEAAKIEAEMVNVRDPRSASVMKAKLREAVLGLLSHPSADEPMVASTIQRLQASILRLDDLERNYREEDAIFHRKRSMQSSYNMVERAKAFSSFDDERVSVANSVAYSTQSRSGILGNGNDLQVSKDVIALIPLQNWIQWGVLPIGLANGIIVVALENPRSGFVLAEIASASGLQVEPVFTGMPREEMIRRLMASRNPNS